MSYGDGASPEELREALSKFRKSEMKLVVKDAIKEWLDEQAALIGRWSFRFILMSALGVLAYFILTSQGWHK